MCTLGQVALSNNYKSHAYERNKKGTIPVCSRAFRKQIDIVPWITASGFLFLKGLHQEPIFCVFVVRSRLRCFVHTGQVLSMLVQIDDVRNP